MCFHSIKLLHCRRLQKIYFFFNISCANLFSFDSIPLHNQIINQSISRHREFVKQISTISAKLWEFSFHQMSFAIKVHPMKALLIDAKDLRNTELLSFWKALLFFILNKVSVNLKVLDKYTARDFNHKLWLSSLTSTRVRKRFFLTNVSVIFLRKREH